MNTNIFIPKRINVGFQNRDDTYTGKLAYVIYYDEKGKLRKEASWQGWRDHKIDNQEFDNIPTEGFVLNKKVGGDRYGWNPRQTYCRVYDPRGFEFEITIPNLLFILENTNSIKGKGLEGEFVYGWDGKELVLVPVESQEYKDMKILTTKIENAKRIMVKDLIVGATYLDKDNKEYIYMGKYKYYGEGYEYLDKEGNIATVGKLSDLPCDTNRMMFGRPDYVRHIWINNYEYKEVLWFAEKYTYENRQNEVVRAFNFCRYSSVPKRFIECVNDKVDPEYQDALSIMRKQESFSPIDTSKVKYIRYSLEEMKTIKFKEFYGRGEGILYVFSDTGFTYDIIQLGNNEYIVLPNFRESKKYWRNKLEFKLDFDYRRALTDVHIEDFSSRFEVIKSKDRGAYYMNYNEDNRWYYSTKPMTMDELVEKLKPCYCETYLVNGELCTTTNKLID